MTTTIAIHPIKTDADLAETTRRSFDLRHAEDGTPERDEHLMLLDLIAAYEERHYPMPAFSGRAMLAKCMAEAKLSQTKVPEVGPQSVVSAVLASKRAINARMAKALAMRFRTTTDAFLA